ncbi:MAG: radical SAM protein [Cyclobacteriaceae bacterium]|nr:radical SAM protein [Cyclobacteriaceae bacterium]
MESFYTLQGEGHHSGKAAFFIRLGGCDVGCSWCDVKESWDAAAHPLTDIRKIITQASGAKSRIVVVTGGEPCMYDLAELTAQLRKNGFQTHIETSGAYPITGTWDWICLSPKKFKKPLQECLQSADELKVIVYNKNDFAWAENMSGKVKWGCKLFLQPEWSKARDMMPQIVAYIKNNPHWEISLQIHKFLDIP